MAEIIAIVDSSSELTDCQVSGFVFFLIFRKYRKNESLVRDFLRLMPLTAIPPNILHTPSNILHTPSNILRTPSNILYTLSNFLHTLLIFYVPLIFYVKLTCDAATVHTRSALPLPQGEVYC